MEDFVHRDEVGAEAQLQIAIQRTRFAGEEIVQVLEFGKTKQLLVEIVEADRAEAMCVSKLFASRVQSSDQLTKIYKLIVVLQRIINKLHSQV